MSVHLGSKLDQIGFRLMDQNGSLIHGYGTQVYQGFLGLLGIIVLLTMFYNMLERNALGMFVNWIDFKCIHRSSYKDIG